MRQSGAHVFDGTNIRAEEGSRMTRSGGEYVRRLRDGGVAAKVLIIGDGVQRAAIQEQIAALSLQDAATITGYKMDVLLASSDRRTFVIDVIDDDTHIRLYIPLGEVTERGEITYANNGEALSYPVTITCYPVDGVLLTKFSDAAAWA